tara:strand:+ start:546 stop:758 length:213 start_codon:yes stop_codon:yes gene_type:complete
VALPVVKKLPVLLIGKISVRKRNINGTIVLLFSEYDFKKYFLKIDKYKVIVKISKVIENPINPVSVKISR